MAAPVMAAPFMPDNYRYVGRGSHPTLGDHAPMYLPSRPYKLPNNPGLTQRSDLLSRASDQSSTHKSENKLIESVFKFNHCSLLTGRVCASLQACRISSTVPMYGKNVDEKKAFKVTLESYYTKLGFNGGNPFLLDSPENCIVLESDYHIMWKKYGLLCFVPTKETMDELCGLLEKANEDWQKRTDAGNTTCSRYPKKVNKVNKEYDAMEKKVLQTGLEALILDPHNFAPGGCPLQIKTEGGFAPYFTSDHVPFLVTRPRQPGVKSHQLPPAKLNGKISVFAIIVNAYSKIESLHLDLRAPIDEAISAYFTKLCSLMNLIFWIPKGHAMHISPDLNLDQPMDEGGGDQSNHTVSGDQSDDTEESHDMKGSHESGDMEDGMEESHESGDMKDDDSEEEDDSDEDEDNGFSAPGVSPNGLTQY